MQQDSINQFQPEQIIENTSEKRRFHRIFSSVKTFWKNLPKKGKIPLVGLGVVLVVGLIIFVVTGGDVKDLARKTVSPDDSWNKLVIPQRESPFFTLNPKSKSLFGILPKEVFVLTTKELVSLEFISQNIESSKPVYITQKSSTEYEITTQSSMGLAEAVNIRLDVEDKEYGGHTFDRDYGWAYQVQEKFEAVTSIPGDKKTEVPVNSGIEIVFNQDGFEDPTRFLEIEPNIEFRLETRQETLSIVPLKPLEQKTIYRVTLKRGFNLQLRNDPISDDFTFSFQTAEKDAQLIRLSIDDNFIQVAPDNPVQAKVYMSKSEGEVTIQTEVYKFPTSDVFISSREKIDEFSNNWMSYFAEEEPVNTDGLPKVVSADLKVLEKENIRYLQLPENLPEGYYLVKFWYQERQKLEQLWVQSTPLAGYTSVGKEHTIVWANEVKGGSLNQASVVIPGTGVQYVADANGIAKFPTPATFFEEEIRYLKIEKDDKSVVIPVDSLTNKKLPGEITSEDYWSYLYHERRFYQPTDTVHFWGVVKNRNTNQVPATVLVSVVENVYYKRYKEKYLSQTVIPQTDGTFIGSISLTDFPTGWYGLTLEVNDVEVASSQFKVFEYEKPEMTIEVTADKKAIFVGESVNYEATVKFFDGTPASNIPLKIFEAKTPKTYETTTNEGGQVSHTYSPNLPKYEYSRYYPRYESITINPSLTQQEVIEGHGSVYVYGSKLMISTETEQDGNKARLKTTVNEVDLTGINEGSSSEVKGNAVSGQKVKLNIVKKWWEKEEEGTYYDFVEKVTRPRYRYISKEETVYDQQLITNANGEIEHDFILEEGKSYQANIETIDRDGHPARKTEYFYYYQGYYRGSDQVVPELNLEKDENVFSVGEEVKLNILSGNDSYPDTDQNRFLFIAAIKGVQNPIVSDHPEYQFTFGKEHIPNVHVGAIVFTGKFYEKVRTSCRGSWQCSYFYDYYDKHRFDALSLEYKKEDSELDLEIIAGQESYNPGDEAKITVKVSEDGNPVANAQVNIALVDQALVAIGGAKEPTILQDVYQSLPSFVYYSYNTHQPIFPDGPAAEMGGGGGDREIFKDTAFFGQARTDEEGTIEVAFKLPDNITSWIIYAQAATNDLKVGHLEGKVAVSKDFFVTSHFPRVLLQRDEAFLSANSFGKGVNSASSVNYEAIFYDGESEIRKEEKRGLPSQSIAFPFPTLAKGEYSIVLRGKSSDLEDGIRLPVKIEETRFIFENQYNVTLDKGDEIDSIEADKILQSEPVKFVVSDLGKGRYYRQLTKYCYVSSNRLEKQLSKKIAGDVLEDKFKDDFCKVSDEELSGFQYFDGGLSQVSWGGSNLETTAWATYVYPEPFDRSKLLEYLEEQIGRKDTKEKALAAWAMSNLDESQMTVLRRLAEQASSFEDKVIVGIALATAGETELALDIYYDLLADYAYENKPYIRIQAESNREEETVDQYLTDSALALFLGSMVDKKYNKGLYNYLKDYRIRSEEIVLDMADIGFIETEISKLPDENTVVYFRSANEERTEELKGDCTVFILDDGTTGDFLIKVMEGKAEVVTHYFIGPEGFSELPKDDRLTIKRSYEKVVGEGDEIHPGDIIKVTIDFDLNIDKAPSGAYTITDYLPSGLQYLGSAYAYGLETKGWVRQKDNNILEYILYNSPWWHMYSRKKVIYYARANGVGTFVAEPAVLQSDWYLSIFQSTPEDSIEIKN